MPLPPLPRTLSGRPARSALAVLSWLAGWWQLIHFAAQVLVLALSPAGHRRERRGLVARTIYQATWPLLPSFTLLSALVALVVIRIVLATALSYGLSRYALDVLVRTLVLELIPLSAALFVAVRYTLGAGGEVRRLRDGRDGSHEDGAAAPSPADLTRDDVLPRVLAGMFAVVTLATVSGVMTLLLTYLSLYGFSTWGLAGFTRTVGQVFDPVIALIFTLKTLFFALAVAVIPMVDAPRRTPGRLGRAQEDLGRLARLLVVVVLVEVGSLVGNYY